MARVEMTMPKMGESIMEGTVLKWLKQVGDSIEQDESVLEVATDKVDTEVPALHAGVLQEILVQEGQVVAVGAPIAIIETDASAATAAPAAAAADMPAPSANGAEKVAAEVPFVPAAAQTSAAEATAAQPQPGRFYSPLVLSIAREEGISMADLEHLPGTGSEGRVTKKDILDYVAAGKKPLAQPAAAPAAQPQAASAAPAPTPAPTVQAPTPAAAPAQQAASAPAPKAVPSISGNQELLEMDRMRKMIAQRMVDSKRISPHVTSFVEADVTDIVNWRNKHKDAYKKREGENLTFTPIFIQAIARAIQDFPNINVSVEGDYIIKKRDINVGVAVALPSGNLIVPVIHNADQLNLNGLSKRVNDLANRARANKLKPEDLEGGTYTVSNVGSFGNVMGTPIIMQPQVAIMAVGAIKKKPAVIETPQGDLIGVRHFMFLSHSYDHRVVDGSLGGMFVRRVADYLEQFDPNTTI
ncbi:2-oxoglutarate dehydrogenase E2 component (dihydrolipoamide succinyltransferase) [Hymenobacter luteus]|uniref:Dihydrolipoamide acetyltransferase component of pyruvate dehydrogenase complex n=2 Tax=Hymenobacter TaxID=89966 RepID=A0A7W9WBU4_9BACT|nr:MULTISPECIES: dihydrolipoamide acetyltransferase family protein [Hymenobacter]MBB4602208.1 2-oxoglutarate dehydrogenase E2 component (dihydrolipoamide succinyltransferase) [Hymenobacter latericoloratus]MBB6059363.1 2-oxoglutarate dehydrogenase E2 component (dihydrolipoamide succinyltransferase) [Hymenobacter luteus]